MAGLKRVTLIRLCGDGRRRRGDTRVATSWECAGRTGSPLAGSSLLHILSGAGDGPATALTAIPIIM